MSSPNPAPDAAAAAAPVGPGAPFLQLSGLRKCYGPTVAVDAVDLTIGRSEIFALLGSSGCGKSTLLRMLAGFEQPTSGHIVLDGEPIEHVAPYHRPVNMMFQSYALFPHMSVQANVAFGLRQERGISARARNERVAEALELVQMERYAQRKPAQLSGGQQQRVALARSLIKRPKLLLLDEPMSALDRKIRRSTQIQLKQIIERVGVTCVLVTHDQEEAMAMAHRMAVMTEGRLVQVGAAREIYEHPTSVFAADFVGVSNFLDGVVVEDEADHVVVRCTDADATAYVSHGISGPQGMGVTLSIRPEQITLSRRPPGRPHNWVGGTISGVAYLGSHAMVHMRLRNGMELIARIANAGCALPARDEKVYFAWDATAVVVLGHQP